MSLLNRIIFRLTILLLLTAGSAFAIEFEDIRLPANSKTSWIAEDMVQNGVRMQIQLFESALSVNEVLTFYRNRWGLGGTPKNPGYVENTVGEWRVISKLHGKQNVALQLKPGRGSATEGYLSIADLSNFEQSSYREPDFPKPDQTELVSSSVSHDPGKSATTLILMNPHTVNSNVQFYQSAMQSKAWNHLYSKIDRDTGVMMYGKDGSTAEIVISRNDTGESVVLVNIVSDEP